MPTLIIKASQTLFLFAVLTRQPTDSSDELFQSEVVANVSDTQPKCNKGIKKTALSINHKQTTLVVYPHLCTD